MVKPKKMKPEIIFRGQMWENGVWVEGDLIDCGKWKYIAEQRDNNSPFEPEKWVKSISPDTVGLFTNKLDIEGQRLWPGDIVWIGAPEMGWASNGSGQPAEYVIMNDGTDFILVRKEQKLVWGRLTRVDELGWVIRKTGNHIYNDDGFMNWWKNRQNQ